MRSLNCLPGGNGTRSSFHIVAPLTQRRAPLVCRAESDNPSDGSSKKSGQDDIMKRLAKAREYKAKAAQDSPTAATTAAPPPIQYPPPQDRPVEGDAVLNKFGEYASKLAQEEAEKFLLAQQELAARSPPAPAPASAATPTTDSPTNKDLPKDPQDLADIDRSFRGGSGDASQAANWLQLANSQGTKVDQNLRPEEFTLRKEELQRQQGATIERAKGIVSGTKRRKLVEDDGYGLAQQQDEAQASMAADRVDYAAAARAAEAEEASEGGGVQGFKDSLSTEQTQDEQRQEEKYQEEKGIKTDESVHNPAVATWGVFPRPRNISQAYGGGRNLRPGQDLETEEESVARKERVSNALANYRKQMGLDIEPAVEAEAVALFEEGDVLFKAGRIAAALEKFTASAALVPLRSKIGGRSNLQKAICLDSLGRNEEAYPIYTSLEGHTAPGVAKASKRMLFGFKAAKKLKLENMRYDSGGTQAWKVYFDRVSSDAWGAYSGGKEESEEDKEAARNAALLAAAVVLVPLAFVVYLVIAR